jgi:D-aspartate ligase
MTRTLAPVIVLGGAANALSVARNLAHQGIEVVAVNYPHEAVRFSRRARFVRLDDGYSPKTWERFLLGRESDYLRGSVLLACGDEAISIIVDNHAALSQKFLLEEGDPLVRRDLLNKFTICRRAEEADIPTVGYWLIRSNEELERSMEQLRFPLIMKALYGPHAEVLGFKAILVPDRPSLTERFSAAARLGVEVLLMEYIPGGDDRLCSYYTYLDESGSPLVHLTKRLKRRYPRGSGEGTYHVTTWIPEAAELGARFFRHVKLRGLGNIEFKRDERDGRLKIIEVNARFTASDCLIAKSGVNLALITYNRLTGRPQPPVLDYQKSLVLCRPVKDARAAWELRKTGELGFSEWIADLWRVNQFPLFEWRDPMPTVAVWGSCAKKIGAKVLGSLGLTRGRLGTRNVAGTLPGGAANLNGEALPQCARSEVAE